MPILLARSGVASESTEVTVRAAIQIRYQGYIDKQTREIERFKRQENDHIDDDFDYSQIRGLKIEAREKLSRYRPVSIGQASRLEGVTPSDLAVVSVYLRRHKGKT
jgi:tRNA uridine 5-carboxymethylaminomethyl modification enzyme